MEITMKGAFETAIRAEELGITFYSELARRFSKKPELKELFEILAKDEVEHKRQFTELLNNYGDQIFNANEMDGEFLKGVDISKFFPGMETVDDNIKPAAVLARAYAFEKESVLFYLGIRDVMGNSEQIEKIIKIEKEHVVKLMKYVLEEGKFRGISDSW